MRWIFSFFVALLVLWVIYILSPYVALYNLAKAVETKDVAALQERVNFRAVRLSLARQIASAYVRATGAAKQAGASTSSFSTSAATSVVDPLIAPYVTPEAIISLLTKGAPDIPGAANAASSTGAPDTPAAAATVPALESGLNVAQFSFERLKQLFIASESRGFRGYIFALPLDRPIEDRVRFVFRISGPSNGFMWRLVGIELPARVRDQLVQELLKRKDVGSLRQ